jgi:hypothetical protein
MIDIALTLSYLRPNEEWNLNGETYEGLTWLSETPIPTKTEVETAYPLALAEKEAAKVSEAEARQAAIAHAKSLGFTDEMIAVMYPNLGAQA